MSRLEGDIKSLRLQDYIIESLNLALATREAEVQLERLTLAKGANRASLQADYTLPADLSSWDRQPLNFDLAVDAPELSAFVVPDSGASLKGTLKIAGKGTCTRPGLSWQLRDRGPRHRDTGCDYAQHRRAPRGRRRSGATLAV